MNWHNSSISDVYKLLDSSASGLDQNKAELSLAKVGQNIIQEGKKKTVWNIVLHQVSDFMIIILIIAAVISGIAGDLTDTIIILTIIILNALAGFIQEYLAEKAM
ncbi:MAG: cation-transporting P-type ATPase [Daejeonella sp.]|nr:cation-transporting P-type ATPase [Daejeonella sp.]